MSARSPMKWREAATLILVAKKEMARCHFDYRILMLERSSKGKFMVCKSYEYDVIHLYICVHKCMMYSSHVFTTWARFVLIYSRFILGKIAEIRRNICRIPGPQSAHI